MALSGLRCGLRESTHLSAGSPCGVLSIRILGWDWSEVVSRTGTPRRGPPPGGLVYLTRRPWIVAEARPCSCRLRRFGVVPSWGLYFPSATRRHTLSLTYSGRSRSPLSRARSVVGREHGAHALYTRHPGLCSGQLGMRAVLRPIT